MSDLGDYTEDYAALNLKFTSRTAAGVPFTLAGTPVISVYKANSLTQITAGITLTVDFDGVTGLNNVLVDLSSDAAYAIANDYQMIITTGTVNSVSVVGEVVGLFSIENRFDNDTAKAAALTTAQDDLDTITGSDGATLATAQGLYAPAKAGDAMDLTTQGVDDVWDEPLTGATHNVATSGGRRMRAIGDVVSGTVNDVSATTTSFISTLTGGHDDHFADQTLYFTDGSLSGMSRIITTYTSATKEITFDEPLPEAPSNGDAFDVNPVHVHTQSQIADVVWDEILTGGTHNIANSSGKILRNVKELGVYQNGGLWYDTTGRGAAGSTAYENGTVDNPVDNEADLRSLITATGYNTVFISPGSSITLAGTYTNTAFLGKNWALALGGQVVTGLVAAGAFITGICSSGSLVRIEDCNLGAVTMPAGKFVNCGIGNASGTFTGAAAGEYIFDQCYSEVPGSGSPNFVFTGLAAATGINNRGWLGGATYTLDSDCTLSHEVVAGGGTTVTTGGADVEVRGTTRSLTLTLGTASSETVQFCGTTGPISISGSPTAAIVNLYGVGDGLTDTSTGSTVTNKTVSGSNVNTILADTNELQTDWANGGRLDLILDSTLASSVSIGVTKNASFGNLEFLMVDATDHITPETGLTVTGQMSIDGGAFASVNGAIAEVSNGIYQVDLTADDTNGDVITYRFSAAGAADRFITIKTRA